MERIQRQRTIHGVIIHRCVLGIHPKRHTTMAGKTINLPNANSIQTFKFDIYMSMRLHIVLA